MPKKTIKKTKTTSVKKKKVVEETKKTKPNIKELVIETVEIDASGKILGRLSTEVANILRGKDKPSWRPNKICGRKVVITNASKIKVTGNKMENKVYYHHTGYLGHLKSETMKEVMLKYPTEVIRRAITGMLPKNKLQSLWLKNLTIREGE